MKSKDAGEVYQVELKARQDLDKALDRLADSLLLRLFYSTKMREAVLDMRKDIVYAGKGDKGSNITPKEKVAKLTKEAKEKIPFLFRFGFSAAIRKYNKIHQAEGTFGSAINTPTQREKLVVPPSNEKLKGQLEATTPRRTPVPPAQEQSASTVQSNRPPQRPVQPEATAEFRPVAPPRATPAVGPQSVSSSRAVPVSPVVTSGAEVAPRAGAAESSPEVSPHQQPVRRGVPPSERAALKPKAGSEMTEKMKSAVLHMRQEKTRDDRVDRMIDKLFDAETEASEDQQIREIPAPSEDEYSAMLARHGDEPAPLPPELESEEPGTAPARPSQSLLDQIKGGVALKDASKRELPPKPISDEESLASQIVSSRSAHGADEDDTADDTANDFDEESKSENEANPAERQDSADADLGRALLDRFNSMKRGAPTGEAKSETVEDEDDDVWNDEGNTKGP